MKIRFSILQRDKNCFVCGTNQNIHIHEIYFGKNRQKSIEDGCCAYLCANHHNMSNAGVHFNHELDMYLKQLCQTRWMEFYNKDIEKFRQRYGKSYL